MSTLTATRRRRLRLRRPRRPVWTSLQVTHRWLSLVLGLLLLVITTSGCVLLFRGELLHATNPKLYRHTASEHPISPARAVEIVRARYPADQAQYADLNRGVYQVYGLRGEETTDTVNVDPGTGRILGRWDPDGGVLGFLVNLHDCAFTCKGYPGYIGALNAHMVGLGIPGLSKLTIGAVLLGVLGLLMVFLAVSGIVLWWPGRRRLRQGFAVRWGKGRYGRDYDLHKVIGFAAIPLVLMWGVTGAYFYLPVVSEVWYGILPGSGPKESDAVFASKKGKGPDIPYARAAAIARDKAGGGKVLYVAVPPRNDPTATWEIGLGKGFNTRRDYTAPANVYVNVDRRTGASKITYGDADVPVSRTVLEDWSFGIHAGMPVGWVPRLAFLAFGLTPLILAVTGLSTWLWRRGRRKEKRRRAAVT